MPDTAALHSMEELREALLATGRDRDALMLAHSHAQHLLAALDSLLRVSAQEDPFSSVFPALHEAFTFAQAMVLVPGDDAHMECIVGHPASLVGSRWPKGLLFSRVAASAEHPPSFVPGHSHPPLVTRHAVS